MQNLPLAMRTDEVDPLGGATGTGFLVGSSAVPMAFAALFREHQEIIEAGRLRGPVYKVIQGAALTKWVGCS